LVDGGVGNEDGRTAEGSGTGGGDVCNKGMKEARKRVEDE